MENRERRSGAMGVLRKVHAASTLRDVHSPKSWIWDRMDDASFLNVRSGICRVSLGLLLKALLGAVRFEGFYMGGWGDGVKEGGGASYDGGLCYASSMSMIYRTRSIYTGFASHSLLPFPLFCTADKFTAPPPPKP